MTVLPILILLRMSVPTCVATRAPQPPADPRWTAYRAGWRLASDGLTWPRSVMRYYGVTTDDLACTSRSWGSPRAADDHADDPPEDLPWIGHMHAGWYARLHHSRPPYPVRVQPRRGADLCAYMHHHHHLPRETA